MRHSGKPDQGAPCAWDKGLTVISNNAGVDDFGIGMLLQARQIRKMISTYVGENKEFERQFLSGEIEVELVPQGTFAERIRAAGAGVGGFLHADRVRHAGGRRQGDAGDRRQAVRARSADPCRLCVRPGAPGRPAGNLVYHRTARNFNPVMATAARVTIAEVEELVEPGQIDPGSRHDAGHLRASRGARPTKYENRIEKRTIQEATRRPRGTRSPRTCDST